MIAIGIIITVIVFIALLFFINIEDCDGDKNWGTSLIISFLMVAWAWLGSGMTWEQYFKQQGEINQLKGTPTWEMKILYEINENGEPTPADTIYIKIKK